MLYKMHRINYYATTLLLNTGVASNIKVDNKVFLWQDFFLTIQTFCQLPDSALSAVKFPQISRFSRQVVTLFVKQRTQTYISVPILLTKFTLLIIHFDFSQ